MFYQELDQAVAHYNQLLEKYHDDPRSLGWKDYTAQQDRFSSITQLIREFRYPPEPNTSVRLHDVGCGLAHLYDYLTLRDYPIDYVGSDLSQMMVGQAFKRLNEAGKTHFAIHYANLLGEEETAEWMRSDYLVASGLFHYKQDTLRNIWWTYVQEMLHKMFNLSRLGIIFNMMSSYTTFSDPNLFYLSPAILLEWVMLHLSQDVALHHHPQRYEYTVGVYKR